MRKVCSVTHIHPHIYCFSGWLFTPCFPCTCMCWCGLRSLPFHRPIKAHVREGGAKGSILLHRSWNLIRSLPKVHVVVP